MGGWCTIVESPHPNVSLQHLPILNLIWIAHIVPPLVPLPLVPPAVPEVGKAAGSTATDDHEAHRNRFGHSLGGSSEKSGQTARENGEKWLDFEDFDMTGKG